MANSKSSSMTPADAAGMDADLSTTRKSSIRRAADFLQTDVDAKKCNPVSIYACFLTGFTSAPSFSVSGFCIPRCDQLTPCQACYVWCGFQT
jgi:hypothetical protein